MRGGGNAWVQGVGFKWAAREVVAQEAVANQQQVGTRRSSKATPLRSLPLRMIDTIFFKPPCQEGGSVEMERWVYTNKSGTVVERRREELTWEKIQERLSRFALANPENKRRTVACLYMQDGTVNSLDEPGLRHLAIVATGARTSKDVLAKAAFLQCYVRPHAGIDQVCRARYSVDGGQASLDVRMLPRMDTGLLAPMASGVAMEDERVQEVVEACAWEVVRYLETAGGVLTNVKVDFIVDDNKDPWISSIHSLDFLVKPLPPDLRAEQQQQQQQYHHHQQQQAASGTPAVAAAVAAGRRPLGGSMLNPPPAADDDAIEPCPQPPRQASPVRLPPEAATPETEEVPPAPQVPLPRVPPALNSKTATQQHKIDRVMAAYSEKPKGALTGPASSLVKSKADAAAAALAAREAMDVALRAELEANQKRQAGAGATAAEQKPQQAQVRARNNGSKGGSDDDIPGAVTRGEEAEPAVDERVLRRVGPKEAQMLKEFQAPAPGDVDLMGIIKENRRFNEVMIGLRERNAALEDEIKLVRDQSKKSEEARLQAETEARDAQRKMLSTKQACTRALQEKDEANERAILELEGKHTKELAAKAAEMASLRSQEAKGEVTDAQKGSSVVVMNKGLVQKLEDLEMAFSNAKVEWAREKRQIMSSHAQEIQELNMLNREQGSSNLGYIAQLEDQIEDLKTQIDDARKLVTVVEAREREANARRMAAEAEQERLAGDKRQLQDHLQAAQGFEVTQDNGVAVDGEKALAALAATSEARVRQANNKVEYLKAQLASEQTLKAELEATVSGMKEKLIKQKQESKKLLTAAEEAKKQAVRDTEERLRQDMESYISEVSHLQGKVMTLQGQLGDALQDVGLAKRREEGQKSETNKANLEVSALQVEIEVLKKQMEENARAVALDEDYRAKLATSEAMLRRLDNERLYLKSQLATEITCKNELQVTLDQAHREYAEARGAWKKEREELDEQTRQAINKRESMEAEFKRYRSQADMEVATLTQQNSDLKTSYSKTRDQLRIEQSAVERVQAANRRLQDELLAQHEELKNARAETDGAARRQTENLELVKASMEQIETEKAGEIARLQTELHTHLKRMGDLQEELVQHKKEEASANRRAHRLLGAQKIFHALEKWRDVRRLWVLYSWRHGSLAVGLEDAAEKRLRQAVHDTAARSRSEMEEALAALTGKLRGEKQKALERVTQLAEEEMDRIKKEADEEKGKDIAELNARSREAVCNKQMQAEEVLTRLGFRYQETIARLKFQEEEKMLQEQMAHEATLARLKKEAEQRIAQATREANDAAEQRWQTYVKDKLSDVKQERAHDLDAARDQYRRMLDRREEAFAKEKEEMQTKAQADRETAVERERSVLEQRIADAVAGAEAEFKVKMAEAQRHHAAVVKQVQAEGDERVRQVEEEVKKQEKSHVKATVELRRTMDEQRSKAVRMEITKCQRALSEAEQQLEMEKKAAWKRGVDERDNQAKHEIAQLKIAGEVALSHVRESARRSLEVAQRKAAEILELTRERLVKEKEDALRELKDRVEKELREQWEEAMRDAMDKADKAKAAAIQEEKRQAKVALSKLEMRFNEERVMLEAKEQQLQALVTAAKDETDKVREAMRVALAEADQAFERARASWADAQREALWKQAQELLKEKESALQEAARVAEAEQSRVVEEWRRKGEADVQATISRLQAERVIATKELEKVIARVQQEMSAVQGELTRKTELLAEAVGRHDELQTEVATEHQRSSFHKMRMMATINKTREMHNRDMEAERRKWEEKLRKMAEEEVAACEQLQGEIANLQDIIHKCEARRLEMYETLVNHKREVLMEHKVQSEVLAREAEQLAYQRESVETRKKELQRELKRAEEGVKELEHELHEHGKKSAIKHGRIDVAHARKKKRLDEDLEAAIETIEAKRTEITSVDEKLSDLLDLRQDKEDEMKVLERKLVEVLVEQQKKLLQILNEEGVMITDGLDKAGPHIRRPPVPYTRSIPSMMTVSSPTAAGNRGSIVSPSHGGNSNGGTTRGGSYVSASSRSPSVVAARSSSSVSESPGNSNGRGGRGSGAVGRKGGRLSEE